MAPEVGLGKPYNLSADVYSWSMILWFLLALEPPFGEYTQNMMLERVFRRGSRPAIFSGWSNGLADLMRRSWQTVIAKRPTFREIGLVLKRELLEIESGGGGAASTASTVSGYSSGENN